MLTIIEVKDNEIVLQYENGNFKNLLVPGRYTYWKGVINYSFIVADLSQIEIGKQIEVNTLIRKEVLPCPVAIRSLIN